VSFTSAESYKIRKYLGYPQVYRQSNPRLESAIEVVGNDVDAVADVRDILSKIAVVESFLTSALDTAGLKSADNQEVEWYPDKSGSSPVVSLNQQANKFCNQLSIIFGVPIICRIFGTEGYIGDQWKQFGSMTGAGFNFNLGFR